MTDSEKYIDTKNVSVINHKSDKSFISFFSFLVVWTIHNFHKKDCRIIDHCKVNEIFHILLENDNAYHCFELRPNFCC